MHQGLPCGGEEGIAIFIVDDEPIGSEIVYVNHAFAKMSGYAAEQLVGHSALLLAGARPNRERVTAAMFSRKPYRMRDRKVRPDGSAYDVEVRFELLRGGDPKAPPRVVVTQRQILGGVPERPGA